MKTAFPITLALLALAGTPAQSQTRAPRLDLPLLDVLAAEVIAVSHVRDEDLEEARRAVG